MAQNNVLMFSVFVVVMFLTTVQANRYRQLRPANEFQLLDIVYNSPPNRELVDRSKRDLEDDDQDDDKDDDQDDDLMTGRGFGKRIGNHNVDTIKQFLQDWEERLQMSQGSSDPSFIDQYFLRQ